MDRFLALSTALGGAWRGLATRGRAGMGWRGFLFRTGLLTRLSQLQSQGSPSFLSFLCTYIYIFIYKYTISFLSFLKKYFYKKKKIFKNFLRNLRKI